MTNWETKKLGDILQLSNEKSITQNEFPVLTSSRSGLCLQSDYFKKIVASKNNIGYKIIKNGQFTYRAMSDDGYFKFNRLSNQKAGIISPAYEVFDVDEGAANAIFIYYLLNSIIISSQIYNAAQGGTRLALRFSTLAKFRVKLPPLNEQKKIAEILSRIDNKISLSKQKVQKKGFLLKAIFNSELLAKDCKSLVPLSEVGIWKGGGTPSKSIQEYWKGSIPWVSPKDMNRNRIYDTEDHINSKAIDNSSALLINKGSILFVVRSGILRNKLPIAVAEKDLTINQDLKSLEINSQWDKDFIFYFLKSNSDKIRSSCMKVGTTVESIASDLLMEYMIPSVSKSIQVNLGKVARRIDQSMEFENYSIDSIISLKNALLQDLLSGRKRVSI